MTKQANMKTLRNRSEYQTNTQNEVSLSFFFNFIFANPDREDNAVERGQRPFSITAVFGREKTKMRS